MLVPDIVLETERLLLRRLTCNDADDLAAVYADPETMRFFGGPRNRAQALEEIDWCLECYERNVSAPGECGPAFWATIHKADTRFLGRCGLLPQSVEGQAEAEVAYMIARPYWNQGLGTEAARAIKRWGFAHVTFPRLISLIDPDNIASIRVAEKNGMHREKEVMFDGYRHVLYSISRADYAAE
jgi:ribosomal-protein-alanine N-acetyltransferase